jgi:hypothetical protein
MCFPKDRGGIHVLEVAAMKKNEFCVNAYGSLKSLKET